jgi:peptidoglycan LD-endopeptidase LytH
MMHKTAPLEKSPLKKYLRYALLIILIIGLLIPQRLKMPVQGADRNSYHPQSFWYYPWGRSVTHKGVDIFAAEGTPVLAATSGLVLYSGEIAMGGKILLILGPKWRVHYYAHLQEIQASTFSMVSAQQRIGAVGTTGNAKGKAPHLHYSLVTLIPYPWRIDLDRQGWKKMFFLNPIDELKKITVKSVR